jgi:serine protease Do
MSVAGDNGNTGVAMGTKAMLEALAREADAVVERLRRSVVAIRSPVSGGGSGIIWQDDGLVITNSHVVRGERAEIQTWDGRVLPARLVARDPEFDLAALRVNAAGLPATVVGDSRAVRTGQIVLAVGHPWGERWSVTAGIVLGVGEAVPTPPVPLPESIRADLRLAPGNSGGPLADAEGRVIGVNAMIAGGMAVAVPSNAVARFLAGETLARGYLGILGQPVPLPPAIAAALRSEDGAGLLLIRVVDGSPAARAGLLPGDVIVGLDDARGRLDRIAARLRHLRPGSAVRLELLRGGVPRVVEAVPVARS